MSTWTCAKCGAFGPLNDWNIDKAECGVDGCEGARAHTARELSFAREASACRFEMHHLGTQLSEARAALAEIAEMQKEEPESPNKEHSAGYNDGIETGRFEAAENARLRAALESIAALQFDAPVRWKGFDEKNVDHVYQNAKSWGRYEAAEVARKALGGGK